MSLTYLIPLALAVYALLFFVYALSRPKPEPACDLPRPARFSLPTVRHPLRRCDALPMLLVTAVYAAAAFFLLGSTTAPEQFQDFAAGESVVIVLPEPTALSRLDWYPGLDVGSYRLERSADGEHWYSAGTLEQEYATLFRWHELALDGSETAYLRLTADAELSLGEVILRDTAGQSVAAEGGHLTDEPDSRPEGLSWFTGSYFDEIYHVRTAREMLQGHRIYETTHPPLGKLLIAAGIAVFGMNPFGWRFVGTCFGVLMLPLMYILIKHLFGKTDVAACGTAILACDFLHFTQTRIATIDTYAVFFILLASLFLYRFITGGSRWELAACGTAFGLGAACKWTVLYAGAGLALLWLLYWIGQRHEAHFPARLGKNILWCLLWFVAVPCLIYYLSYYPYGTANGLSGVGMYASPRYLRIVLHNQQYMFSYHSKLVAEHPYASRWWQWLLDLRPILYYLEALPNESKSAFGAFNNPLVSWGGLLAVLYLIWDALHGRDGRSLFILIGYLAGLLPWLGVERLTFAYHYFPCTVFLVLALCRVFDRLPRRRAMLGFTAVCAALFAAFYPVISGVAVPRWYTTNFLRWFPGSWPF